MPAVNLLWRLLARACAACPIRSGAPSGLASKPPSIAPSWGTSGGHLLAMMSTHETPTAAIAWDATYPASFL